MNTRNIHSFTNRQRRLSPRRQKILHENWSIYGLDTSAGKAPIKKNSCQQFPTCSRNWFRHRIYSFQLCLQVPSAKYFGH